jgi:hypothetical protein
MASSKTRNKSVPPRTPNPASHQAHCSVCKHPKCEEIENEYVAWRSPADIASEYKLPDRSAVYRHALALGLGPKRDRNIRAALGRIIEKADTVRLTAGGIVQAIDLYARLNAQGEIVERDQQVGGHDLLVNPDELEAYARGETVARLMDTKSPQGTGGIENA